MAKKVFKIIWNSLKIVGEWLFIFIFFLSFYLAIVIPIDYPEIEDLSSLELTVVEKGGHRFVENSWFKQNPSGIFEVYIEGEPFERGVKYGKLILDQNELQEGTFVSQIEEMIPSSFYRFFLKVFVGWFNRDLDISIPEEYMKEIYGESFFMSDKYDYVAPKFYRILNYHAAHDIGHALQGMHMVGCTSFALKGSKTEDGKLIIGRNFDFYVGKEFAQQKLLLIVKPDDGYGFVSYSWPGFLGVASGMNEHGLSVTLNASKSELPSGAKVPISILAREILQYAKTIEEAYEICKNREVFVSESLLIGSAIDGRAAIIEKSPLGYDIYEPQKESLVCANHYQSEFFVDSDINIENIKESDSKYRFDRMTQLIAQKDTFSYTDVAGVLRNYLGLNDDFIGYGNPKSINQFIANHSVIFKPEEKLMWVSTDPYQMGKFICYDLNAIFKKDYISSTASITRDSLSIPSDPFIATKTFKKFQRFKDQKEAIQKAIMLGKSYELTDTEAKDFIALNPESYIAYMVLGEYYLYIENKAEAERMFKLALTKSVASQEEENKIEKYLEDL